MTTLRLPPVRLAFESRHRWPLPILAALLLLLTVGACQRSTPTVDVIAEAQRLLDEGKTATAASLLEAAAQRQPDDPQLRIEIGRVQNAQGQFVTAEGTLRRALELGAMHDEVLVPLAQSLLGQRQADAALQLIGDPDAHAQRLRLPLTELAAEALLRLGGTDRRRATRAFVDAFRRREERVDPLAADRDARAAAGRLSALEASEPLVRAAREHFQCTQAHAAAAPGASGGDAPAADTPGRRVLEVGPRRGLRKPSEAAAVAEDGDVIAIDAGDYPGDVALWPQSGLTLRGVGGRVRLDSLGHVAEKQGIWVFRGNDITVENVEFSGARGPGRNGSGIRFLGRNLTVRNSVFHDNEAGLLTWKDPESDILVERSTFYRNGYGDGQSHNIYIGEIRSFTLRHSYSHDAHVGHEVKSRAHTNYILYNRLTDEDDGDSSYLVDLPEGGDAYVVGNVLLKGARAANPHAISYAAEKPDVDYGQLWVVNNTLWNRYPYAVFVRNASRRPATLANNVAAGAPLMLLKGPGTGITNYAAQRPGLRDPAKLDDSPTEDSPLIDAGTDMAARGDRQLVAAFEYAHPAGKRPRPRVGPIDIGAVEFCGW